MTPFYKKKKFWLILVGLIGTSPVWATILFDSSSDGASATLVLLLAIPLAIFTGLALFAASGIFDFINSRSKKPSPD